METWEGSPGQVVRLIGAIFMVLACSGVVLVCFSAFVGQTPPVTP
jgi:hypothetical protein